MASNSKTQEEARRGMFRVPIPNLCPVVWTAQEATGLAPGCFRMWSNQDWLLLYVFTPTKLRVDQPIPTWRVCAAKTAVLIPPYNYYSVDTRAAGDQSKGHHCWLSLQALDPSPVFAMLQNPTGMVRFIDEDGLLGRRILDVVDVADRLREDAFWAMQRALTPVMRCLERSSQLTIGVYSVRAGNAIHGAKSLIPGVLTYLQNNLAKRTHTAELAAMLRLSPSTVSHAYRKLTGETPMQTLRRLRIQRLKTLLVQNLSLDAAAHEVGFYDAHHASREFKRAEGMTPTTFLQIIATGGPQAPRGTARKA